MTCKICLSPSEHYLNTEILGKYDVAYYKCNSCKFIFTEDPYWLNEAYSSAITKLDIGLVWRNEMLVPIISAIIDKWFDSDSKFIDYGGGYGLLVRMMRDRGYDYYRQDIHCENLFAESFDILDVSGFQAELITSFEVFEHLVNPVQELEKMLSLGKSVLFSTKVQPSDNVTPETWWYFTPQTGQHIALYSRDSLKALALKFGMNYYWNDNDIHLFTKKNINNIIFRFVTDPRVNKWYYRTIKSKHTLIPTDFSLAMNKLNQNFNNKH